MKEIIIYTKENCSLCDKAKEVIDRVRQDIELDLSTVDITTDEELFARYQHTIPVVTIDGVERFKYKVSEKNLRKLLKR